MMALLVVCAVSYVPLLPPAPAASAADGSRCSLWKKYIDFSIWKNRRYTIWAIALPICMLGYFVPYVHVVRTHIRSFFSIRLTGTQCPSWTNPFTNTGL